MNARELIAVLHAISSDEDIGEFEAMAYDELDQKWRPVFGLTLDRAKKRIILHTD